MNDIAVCIPTYKRPLMLQKLILSIKDCIIDELLIKNLSVIVIDNDVEKTAASIVLSLGSDVEEKFKLCYFNYPIKGLSNVRNELLRKSFELAPDFIVFVDDDEYVTPRWLNELIKTIVNNNADAARGPVFAVNSAVVPKYISCWFEARENYPDNTQLFSLVTNNLILRYSSLQKYDVWFDRRFNFSGSEDSYFGIQILQKGAKICWSGNAKVYETIPESRASIKWLLKRTYRSASTFSYTLKLEKEYLLILKKIIVSIIYLIFGILASTALLFNYKKKYWGLLKIAEGLGGFAGLFNITYPEYAK
jgi:succinoglycan biosynthesis protein ExoM